MAKVIMCNAVGWALNRLNENPPPSLIQHSDPEMLQRFTEVASWYLHHGFESKPIERIFNDEITRQVDMVKCEHFLIAPVLMRVASEGLNAALRLTLADKKTKPETAAITKVKKRDPQMRKVRKNIRARLNGRSIYQLEKALGCSDRSDPKRKQLERFMDSKTDTLPATLKEIAAAFSALLGKAVTPEQLQA